MRLYQHKCDDRWMIFLRLQLHLIFLLMQGGISLEIYNTINRVVGEVSLSRLKLYVEQVDADE